MQESHSTLRFACRAKRVVNNAMVNEVLSDAAVLKRQANEIEELRRVLAVNGCRTSFLRLYTPSLSFTNNLLLKVRTTTKAFVSPGCCLLR